MSQVDEVEAITMRRFFDGQNSSYILPADSNEGKRLDNQHHHLRAAAEGTLVFAPVELKDGDRVLDCATGTGICPLELAAQSPSGSTFQCIDISPHLSPSPAHIPSNVSFSCESILALPSSFDNEFTLVHQRLLIGALRMDEWPSVLQTLYRVTKPGGWVQLCEVHIRAPCDQRSDTPATKRLVEAYMQKLYDSRGLDSECALHLEGWARDAGFVNIRKTVRTLTLAIGARTGDPTYRAIEYFTATAAPTVACGAAANEEEYLVAVEAARREWNEVEDATLPFYWVWAQKPEKKRG